MLPSTRIFSTFRPLMNRKKRQKFDNSLPAGFVPLGHRDEAKGKLKIDILIDFLKLLSSDVYLTIDKIRNILGRDVISKSYLPDVLNTFIKRGFVKRIVDPEEHELASETYPVYSVIDPIGLENYQKTRRKLSPKLREAMEKYRELLRATHCLQQPCQTTTYRRT